MRIGSVDYRMCPVAFGNALSTKQEKEYIKLMDEIKKEEDKEDSIRIVKLYTPALPSSEDKDTGIGKVNSEEAKRFYQMAHVYGGATAIKFMPMGQLTDKPVYNDMHKPCPYDRSALSIGEDVIDITKLAEKEWGNILPDEAVEEFIEQNKKDTNKQIRRYEGKIKPENYVNFQTTLGWKNQEEYNVNDILFEAFDNFKYDESPSDELIKMREDFEEFKVKKEPVDYDDIYSRLAIFPFLKDDEFSKTNFFVGFDRKPEVRKQKMPEYEALKEKYKDEIEFYKFKQFLAHRTLKEGIDLIRAENMDAIADCEIGFSWVEEQCFPDAFVKDLDGSNAQIGNWGLGALNYYDLMKDKTQSSPAHKLLGAKLSHLLSYYDGIRLDVGWSYMNPSLNFNTENGIRHEDAGTTITDYIEKVAKDIKGENYDQRKIIYECDADGSDFNLWANSDKLKKIKGLAVLSTEEEKNDYKNEGWASYSFYKENIGLRDDDFILGTNNHDKEGVINSAFNKNKATEGVGALLRVFRRRIEDGYPEGWKLFKDNHSRQKHLEKYSKGRFSEVDLAKNQFILYTDFLGRKEKVDYHTDGTGPNGDIDYKTRMERNFEENANKAWQSGIGYNQADIKQHRAKLDGSYKRCPKLYEAAEKYAQYIRLNGGIYTREEADKSELGNLNITDLSLEEIQKLSMSA